MTSVRKQLAKLEQEVSSAQDLTELYIPMHECRFALKETYEEDVGLRRELENLLNMAYKRWWNEFICPELEEHFYTTIARTIAAKPEDLPRVRRWLHSNIHKFTALGPSFIDLEYIFYNLV